MADLDAEMAFLSSMQAMNDTAGTFEINGGVGEQQSDSQSEEEYDPAQAVNDGFTTLHAASVSNVLSPSISSYETARPDPTTQLQMMAPTSKPGTPVTDNPSTFQFSSQVPSRTDSRGSMQTSANPSKPSKSRTIGGFIVDDDSDDDTSAQTVGLNGVSNVAGDSSHTLQSVSHTPKPDRSTPDVSIQNAAQNQGASAVVPSGATDSVPNLAAVIPDTGASFHDVSTVNPIQTLLAPQITVPESPVTPAVSTLTAAVPKARLPHDRVGILEDRIKQDARGDMDAWISLINEHRKRNKLDDARNVYERFFKVFPAAVSHRLYCIDIRY